MSFMFTFLTSKDVCNAERHVDFTCLWYRSITECINDFEHSKMLQRFSISKCGL